MDSGNSHIMSLEQLDHLWKYEFRLCSTLTGLPLRTCSAKPSTDLGNQFPAMKADEFRLLKQDIRQMWIKAAYYFRFKNEDGKGWGIFTLSEEEEGYTKTGLLSKTQYTVLGWIAKAPNTNQCPTAHRYLRSPLGEGFYLGGPVSLANQDPVGRITVNIPNSQNLLARHLIIVYSSRKLPPGSELLWTYCAEGVKRQELHLHPTQEWFLTECCGEGEAPEIPADELPCPSAATSNDSEQPAKRRKRGGIRPLTKSRELRRFCLCPYCGLNVDPHSKYSPNLKRHLSLHHAVDLVKDLGKNPLDKEDPVSAKEFVLLLDKISNVLDALHVQGFNYQPACSFLKNSDKEVKFRKGKPINVEKERVFQLFLTESKYAFKNYQVVFLRGVSSPTSYEDLLPCSKYTNHDEVIWQKKPFNNLFSIKRLDLNDDELDFQRQDVKFALLNITTTFNLEDSDSE